MAPHLQDVLARVVGVDNAAFDPLADSLQQLADELALDLSRGWQHLARLRAEALAALPPDLARKALDKVVVVTMGRRVSQKLHEVFVESVRQLLTEQLGFPLLAVFATTSGDATSPARLERIQRLADQFPENVVWTDGRLPYYAALMNAVDFNCMSSLMEPHGGAFSGTVVPLARAIDGLAAQVCAYQPAGWAAVLNARWHAADEPANGLTYREERTEGAEGELRELLTACPVPANATFAGMRAALSAALRRAVDLRQQRPLVYAGLVLAALRQQQSRTWPQVLTEVQALLHAARAGRELPG
jgi:glycosyltransferase involved in cell wall biosynthesis